MYTYINYILLYHYATISQDHYMEGTLAKPHPLGIVQ